MIIDKWSNICLFVSHQLPIDIFLRSVEWIFGRFLLQFKKIDSHLIYEEVCLYGNTKEVERHRKLMCHVTKLKNEGRKCFQIKNKFF